MGYATRVRTTGVKVEQEQFTLLEYPSLPLVFSGVYLAHVVLLIVLVLCWDVCHDFRLITMLGSSLTRCVLHSGHG